jgi:hypothetical protein
MRRPHFFMALASALAMIGLAPPAAATILYQSTATPVNGMVTFDDSVLAPSVFSTGSTWIGISGGRLESADWSVFGDFAKLWWEEYYDEFGNPMPYLNGNEYMYWNGCSVSRAAPVCQAVPSLRAHLHNNTVRLDFIAPESFNHCTPFDGVYYVDCAAIFHLQGANFQVRTSGLSDVTLTISDARIPGAIPEPASWAMLIAGFGLVGAAQRRIRRTAATGHPA